jgi:hypothetical protein
MTAPPREALEALEALSAAALVPEGWRCAVCGCSAAEAGRRMAQRGQKLLARAVTCGENACQRERQRQRMRELFGPGTAYYRRAQKRQKAARRRRRQGR